MSKKTQKTKRDKSLGWLWFPMGHEHRSPDWKSLVEVLDNKHHPTRHPKVNLLASYTTLLFWSGTPASQLHQFHTDSGALLLVSCHTNSSWGLLNVQNVHQLVANFCVGQRANSWFIRAFLLQNHWKGWGLMRVMIVNQNQNNELKDAPKCNV